MNISGKLFSSLTIGFREEGRPLDKSGYLKAIFFISYPKHIKEALKMHHHKIALFLQTVYAIEKLLAGFLCATRNWYESFLNLTALSRDAADDVTWVHTASSTFLFK